MRSFTSTYPTSPAANDGRFGCMGHPLRAGMTLIEVMIVVALMAALIAITAFGLGFIGQADVRGEAVRFSGVIRYIYNMSATQNRTLQLMIDMEEGSFKVDELHVSGGLSLDELTGANLQTALDDDGEDHRAFGGGRLDEDDMEFAPVQRSQQSGPLLTSEDSVLTPGVHFIGVMTGHHEEMQYEGTATINFFPSGYVERTIIYIGDEQARETRGDQGSVYSLLINPLTGQSKVVPGMVPIEESFFEAEEAD